MSEIIPKAELDRVQEAIEEAIRYARGAPNLVELDEHQKNLAELGARRAIACLFLRGTFTVTATSDQ